MRRKVVAVAMAVCSSISVYADDPSLRYFTAIDEALKQVDGVFTGRGFANGGIHLLRLQSREHFSGDLKLGDSKAALLVAACDEGCSGIRLELRDPSGKLVDSDSGSTSLAGVAALSTTQGSYRLSVAVTNCESSLGCFVGLARYSR